MLKVELLHCPFCNSSDMYETTDTDGIGTEVPVLFCNSCKMIFKVENDSPYSNEDETFKYLSKKLYEKFNTRKPLDNIIEQLEKRVKHTQSLHGKKYMDYGVLCGCENGFRESIQIVKNGGVVDEDDE